MDKVIKKALEDGATYLDLALCECDRKGQCFGCTIIREIKIGFGTNGISFANDAIRNLVDNAIIRADSRTREAEEKYRKLAAKVHKKPGRKPGKIQEGVQGDGGIPRPPEAPPENDRSESEATGG